jgi:preprotein translocase subunit SecF
MKDDLDNLYEKYLLFTDQMAGEHDILAIAAVMMTISMSVYKTVMTDQDYDKILESMFERRSNIQPIINDRTLQ